MTEEKSLMEFPCDFQIKIIGSNTDSFLKDMLRFAQNHYPETTEAAIKKQPSKSGTYLSLTLTVHATNQATLDKLYKDLSSHKDVKMVL